MADEENINPSDHTQSRGFSVELPDSYDTYVDRWAIMIGVSKYKHESLNLKYADRDAEEFYNLMLGPIGGNFKPDHIVKLINHEATTANVTKALRSFLKKPGREDLVIIYFACHGSPDFDRPGNVYLLTHDTDPNDIAGTALPMREIDLSLRENLLSERVVILADTCHSAAIGGGIGRRGTTNSTALVNRYLKEVSTTRGGIALLTSAEAAEVSFEDARWGGGHGVFTHYLLRGMQGEADLNQNGFVTIGELFEYVRAKVQEDTEYRQHPSIGTNPYDRELPLAITFPTNQNPETFPNPISTRRSDSIRTPITNPIPTPRLNSILNPLLNKRNLLSLASTGGIIIALLFSINHFFPLIYPPKPTPTTPTEQVEVTRLATALENERIGFKALLNGDLVTAKQYLDYAEELENGYHAVYDISHDLLTKETIQDYIKATSDEQKQQILELIYKKITTGKYTWKSPEDSIAEMRSRVLKDYEIRIYYHSNRPDLEAKARDIKKMFSPKFVESNISNFPQDDEFFAKYGYPNTSITTPANEIRHTAINIDGANYLKEIFSKEFPSNKFNTLPIGSQPGKYVSIFLGP